MEKGDLRAASVTLVKEIGFNGAHQRRIRPTVHGSIDSGLGSSLISPTTSQPFVKKETQGSTDILGLPGAQVALLGLWLDYGISRKGC
jgi:hypothetical protein